MRWLLVSLAFTTALCGQAVSTGEITGTMLDPDGRPAAGIPVQAVNRNTRAVFRTTVSAKGEFALRNVPPGTYQFTTEVRPNRMLPYSQDNLQVRAGETTRLAVKLEEGITLNTAGDGRDFFAEGARKIVPPAGPTPRMADGKPDFSGYWAAGGPSDMGAPDFQDWAEALSKQRYADHLKDLPTARCLPSGVVRTVTNGVAQRFLQTGGLLVMYAEGQIPRQIFLDGRSHPKDPNPTWFGHSIGHWEDDTLVVDTVGFNDKTWPDSSHPQTERAHVVERYRRTDLGHLELQMRVEDPGALNGPWDLKRTYVLDVHDDIMESICAENEKDVRHMPGQ